MSGEQDIGKGGDQVKIDRSDRSGETLSQDSDLGKEKQQELHQDIKRTENQNSLSDPALIKPLPGETLEAYEKRVEEIQLNRFSIEGELISEDMDSQKYRPDQLIAANVTPIKPIVGVGSSGNNNEKGSGSGLGGLDVTHECEDPNIQADVIARGEDIPRAAVETFNRETLLNPDEIMAQGLGTGTTDATGNRLLAEVPEQARENSVIEKMPGVSPEYSRRVEEWWQSVPERIRKMVVDSSIKIIVAKRANQVMPDADSKQVRRHRGGETYAQLPGFYSLKNKAVVLVESRDLTPGEKRTQERQIEQGIQVHGIPESRPLTETAWHELGHALDYAALDHITTSKEFDDAFKKCLPRLDDRDRERWSYSLDADKNGNFTSAKEELLAEIIRLKYTPAERLEKLEKLMLVKFKEVVDLIETSGL